MDPNEPIFLNLSDGYNYYQDYQTYVFYNHLTQRLFLTKIVYELIDPSIDSTFKYLFTDSDIKILENMLNSLMFPESYGLTIIEILNNEIVRPNQKQNKGTIRSDIVCKAKYNNKIIIIGIEMQIGNYGNFTDRLLKYNVGLSYKYDYNISWINGLFININKSPKYSSYIHLNKYQNGTQQELDFSRIIEIDLQEEINKIFRGENILINNKIIGDSGKEWLKLLGLRLWCPKRNGRYILPKDFILSNNPYFNEAIRILANIPIDIKNISLNLENDIQNYLTELKNAELRGKEEGRREGMIEEKITSAFKLYKGECESNFILEILGEIKLKVKDAISILDEFAITEEGEKQVIDFIMFLIKENIVFR